MSVEKLAEADENIIESDTVPNDLVLSWSIKYLDVISNKCYNAMH